MRAQRVILLAAVLIATAQPRVTVQAQAPAPAPAAPTVGPVQPPPPTPPADYAYAVDSRRDPFVNLFNRGTDARANSVKGSRPDGLAGVAVEEIVVRGIVQSRTGWVAMIAAPSGRSYTVRPGDRLMDGSVRTINGQAVVLLQEVNDPLSLEKQREVRKLLRAEVK